MIAPLMVAIAIFAAAVVSSCKKDKCSGVDCLYGGSCNSGSCKCVAGTGGANCSTIYRAGFSGNTYSGSGSDNDTPPLTLQNYQATFIAPADKNYAGMQLSTQYLNASGNYVPHFTANITLSNCSATGCSFDIVPIVSGAGFRISGSGTISAGSVSLTVIEADTATSGYVQPTLTYTFSSLAKQ